MITIFIKELNHFFSSLIGYIAIMVFLVLIGLFLWVFPDTNILSAGYSSLNQLFSFVPMILMVLVPALTMRSFAEEIKTGTFELLITRPLSEMQIVLGKYLAAFFMVFFALFPTLIYFISIYQLGAPKGNIDTGATWGSYIGLLLLGGTFASIGIFTSAITNNQIIAFILGAVLCFIFFIGFQYISNISFFVGQVDDIILNIGMNAHYASISRGVVDTRDLVYFISLIAIFLLSTKLALQSRKW